MNPSKDTNTHELMADPRMKEMMANSRNQPFNCKRMAYGGFKTLCHL